MPLPSQQPHTAAAAPRLDALILPASMPSVRPSVGQARPVPALRHFPRNSPHAAGRVLAAALVADGEISHIELSRLEDLSAHTRIGLRRPDWLRLIDEFCTELPHGGRGNRPRLDDNTLHHLLTAVDAPALCATLLTLCREAVEADRVVTDDEALMVSTAAGQWRLTPPWRAGAQARPAAA